MNGPTSAPQSHIIEELIEVVWGSKIKPDIFSRWSQGFIFNANEKTALTQHFGGPCAVIAPVQAFLLKNLIVKFDLQNLRKLCGPSLDNYLASSLTEMLSQCSSEDSLQKQGTLEGSHSTGKDGEGPFEVVCLDSPLQTRLGNCSESLNECVDGNLGCLDPSAFHSQLRVQHFENKHSLQNYFESNVYKLKEQFGVLLFLYSVILTKGIQRLKVEMGELRESLIESVEGHGSQALINLMITGRASHYVWDGVKDAGGINLVGIIQRPRVGFLTKLEHLNYVKVGWYLKNPTSPVWVLASETHLTVIFAFLESLITPENEVEKARQVFELYDSEGNNFVRHDKLKDILSKLNLCCDDDFVKFMCLELDPDDMGVILYHKFIEAFFTAEQKYVPPDTFVIHHYNGRESSFPDKKMQYVDGYLTIQESHVTYSSTSDIVRCLSTKWANVDVQWSPFSPSIN